jgi:hypothetical protein
MRDADPFGAFEAVTVRPPSGDAWLMVGYQDCGDASPPDAVFINAAGWLASISTKPVSMPTAPDENVMGAMAAAALGGAQLFKLALGFPRENHVKSGLFDLYRCAWTETHNVGPWPIALELGNLLMVGAGSIGSSAAYCMGLARICCNLFVLDKDEVKVENFNRSPIFGRRTFGVAKATAIEQFLADSTINCTSEPLWWDEFLLRRPRSSFDFDIWLPLANEFGVRRSMQHHVPPLMIHASTTANWGVNHARHIPGRDDCLADRFPQQLSSNALTCSEGPVQIEEVSVDAALPFASFFGGLLITADLVRTQLPGYPQTPNFGLFDWYGSLDTIQAWDRKARPGCICRDQGAAFHDSFNRMTRFRYLFQV